MVVFFFAAFHDEGEKETLHVSTFGKLLLFILHRNVIVTIVEIIDNIQNIIFGGEIQ